MYSPERFCLHLHTSCFQFMFAQLLIHAMREKKSFYIMYENSNKFKNKNLAKYVHLRRIFIMF